MSTRTKGRMLELKAKKKLEDEGWMVLPAPMGSRWSKQNDFFNLWDLIAFKKAPGHTSRSFAGLPDVKFVQVKSNRGPLSVEKVSIGHFKDDLGLRGFCEWWTYWDKGKLKSKQGWDIRQL